MTLVDRVCLASLIAILGSAVYLPATPTIAHAQSAEAEALFRDGRTLIRRGKLAEGCDKLDASERLESSVGTLLNLGDCREKLGKFASAWAAFRKAEAMAKRSGGDEKRQGEAGKRADKLEPRLSNLTIEVPARVDGLIVHRDSEVVDPAVWNTALPVDPGSYTITAEAPGYTTWRLVVPVGSDAKQKTVTVPALVRAAPAPVAAVDQPVVLPRQRMVMRAPGTWSGTRKLSAVLAVLGVGSAGTGVYFGLHSKDLRDRADQRCPLTVCGDAEALRWNADAKTAAMRANVLYIAGGAMVATAMVLWFVGAPDETLVVPAVGDGQVGVSLTGSF
jgi:hypothetical protein